MRFLLTTTQRCGSTWISHGVHENKAKKDPPKFAGSSPPSHSMNLLVSSPMRVGSTWVHEVFIALLRPERRDFVASAEQALAVIESGASCVLKSHRLIDLDLSKLERRLHAIRVLRNFKDSLISRALYCRNTRPREGMNPTREEAAFIKESVGLDDREFVNEFLRRCPVVPRWMEQIVVFERGGFDYTFYYEMLLHNAPDEFLKWMRAHAVDLPGDSSRLETILGEVSFHRIRRARMAGATGWTGVGRWMEWLDERLVLTLDALYLDMRDLAAEWPQLRRPVSTNPEFPKALAESREFIESLGGSEPPAGVVGGTMMDALQR